MSSESILVCKPAFVAWLHAVDPVEDLGLQPLLPPTPATATSTASWTALELQSFQQLLSNTPGLVVLDVREQEERESRCVC